MVGGRQPSGVGARLARHLVRDHRNVEEQFTNFGAAGALSYAVLTGLLLAWLIRSPTNRRRGRGVTVDRAAATLLIGLPVAFNVFFACSPACSTTRPSCAVPPASSSAGSTLAGCG